MPLQIPGGICVGGGGDSNATEHAGVGKLEQITLPTKMGRPIDEHNGQQVHKL